MTNTGLKILEISLDHVKHGRLILSGYNGVMPVRRGDEDNGEWEFENDLYECCPLGAVVIGSRTDTYNLVEDAAEILGASESYADGFVMGFDSGEEEHSDKNYHHGYRDGREIKVALLEQGVKIREVK